MKFTPITTDKMVKKAPPPEATSKASEVIDQARKRVLRARARQEAQQELNQPEASDFESYKAPSKEALLELAEETLPTEKLKQMVKEREQE